MSPETHQIWVAAEGCIGCGMCERVCPCGAMHVIDKQAAIDYDRCISCGMCATKCPKHVIHDRLGIFAAAE
ncbi:4Fe-4S binding protein [Collinsella tanakaei]|nr:4Fe-4S binding protein [Collinsella tanakaei]